MDYGINIKPVENGFLITKITKEFSGASLLQVLSPVSREFVAKTQEEMLEKVKELLK